ncbi:MAG: HAD family hydrolase [Elusimicrobia bacterium]|nr:HAD family hydrolase [Elusimicrobiota bacterium]
MKLKFKAVLFDMDGVLIDSLRAWRATVNEALRQLGYPQVSFRRFKADFGQGTSADSENYMQGRENPDDLERLYSRLFLKHIPLIRPIPGALSLLRALDKKKIKIACVTNSNRRIALKVLKQAKLFSLLDIVIAGDDVKNHKPHPEMVNEALQKLGVSSKDALMIGDSIFDQQAARAAGVPFISFRRRMTGAVTTWDLRTLFKLKFLQKSSIPGS